MPSIVGKAIDAVKDRWLSLTITGVVLAVTNVYAKAKLAPTNLFAKGLVWLETQVLLPGLVASVPGHFVSQVIMRSEVRRSLHMPKLDRLTGFLRAASPGLDKKANQQQLDTIDSELYDATHPRRRFLWGRASSGLEPYTNTASNVRIKSWFAAAGVIVAGLAAGTNISTLREVFAIVIAASAGAALGTGISGNVLADDVEEAGRSRVAVNDGIARPFRAVEIKELGHEITRITETGRKLPYLTMEAALGSVELLGQDRDVLAAIALVDAERKQEAAATTELQALALTTRAAEADGFPAAVRQGRTPPKPQLTLLGSIQTHPNSLVSRLKVFHRKPMNQESVWLQEATW